MVPAAGAVVRRTKVVPVCPIRPGDLVAQRGHSPPALPMLFTMASGRRIMTPGWPAWSCHSIGRVRSVYTRDGVVDRVYLSVALGFLKLDVEYGPIRLADRRERKRWAKRGRS